MNPIGDFSWALINPSEFLGLGVLIWIWLIVDCLRRPLAKWDKILWLILLIGFPGLGAIIYFLCRVFRVKSVGET